MPDVTSLMGAWPESLDVQRAEQLLFSASFFSKIKCQAYALEYNYNFICSRESVNMYISGCLMCTLTIMIIKPVNPCWLPSFYFCGNMPECITSYFSSCSFSTHWASLLNSAVGEKNSLKRKEVWLRPAESLAKGPGIVLVSPAT